MKRNSTDWQADYIDACEENTALRQVILESTAEIEQLQAVYDALVRLDNGETPNIYSSNDYSVEVQRIVELIPAANTQKRINPQYTQDRISDASSLDIAMNVALNTQRDRGND